MVIFDKKNGQGLLEAVVAIGIIVAGLLSVLTLTTSNIMTAGEASSQLLANNLAREGIEAVRIIRDSSWLNNPNEPWYGYVTTADDPTAIPVLDPVSFDWTLDFQVEDLSDSKTAVWRDPNNIYRQSYQSLPEGSIKSKFSRLVTIYPICQDSSTTNETVNQLTCQTGWTKVGVNVVVSVGYSERGKHHVVSLEDKLYNWRSNFNDYAP